MKVIGWLRKRVATSRRRERPQAGEVPKVLVGQRVNPTTGMMFHVERDLKVPLKCIGGPCAGFWVTMTFCRGRPVANLVQVRIEGTQAEDLEDLGRFEFAPYRPLEIRIDSDTAWVLVPKFEPKLQRPADVVWHAFCEAYS